MEAAWRGVRNVFRSRARSIIVIGILSLSVAALVTLLQIAAGIQETNARLGAELGTSIEVRRAGATGMGRGADPLPEEIVGRITVLPHVTKVEGYLFNRSENPGGRFPIWVLAGTEPGSKLRVNSHGEVGTPTLLAGRTFTAADRGRAVAIVGKVWAEEYEARRGQPVTVGATVTLEGLEIARPAEVQVVGLYSAGFVFGDSQVTVPLTLAQQMTGKEGKVTNVFVKVDTLDNVGTVEEQLRATLGEEVDVLSGRENLRVLEEGLGGIQASATLSALVATIGGALIVLLTMVLVTQERTSEIGMLKALGASGDDVAWQFIAEALAIGVISALLGLSIFATLGSRLGSLFLGLSSFALPVAIPGFSEQRADQLPIRYALSLATAIYAAGVAVLFGAAGSLYPVLRALRLRPADALRHT